MPGVISCDFSKSIIQILACRLSDRQLFIVSLELEDPVKLEFKRQCCLSWMFFADLCIVVDEEQGAADQLVGGEEWRTDATILDQLQTVQVHVLEI